MAHSAKQSHIRLEIGDQQQISFDEFLRNSYCLLLPLLIIATLIFIFELILHKFGLAL